MSNNIVPFEYHGREVRTLTIDGEPWFVLTDLCRVLDIANARNVAARLDDDQKGVRLLDTPGGRQNLTVVSEAGMYEVVLRSDKPEAVAFRRWITSDVLPTIRKTGRYGSDVDMLAHLPSSQMLQLAAEAAKRAEEAEAQIERDKPKVLFADSVAASKSTVLVGELAKILRANGVEVGQNRMFELLRQEGYLIKREGSDWNMPTQKSMELGLFEIKETAVTHSDGHVSVSKTPKVTGRGQQYFINRYARRAVAA